MIAMNRFTIVILTFLSSFAMAPAQNLVLHKAGGETVIIPVKDAAEITFTGTQINIGTTSMNLDDVARYEFTDMSGIDDVIIDCDIDGLQINPRGIIVFTNASLCSSARVYSASGVECACTKSGDTLDFSGQPAGVYVISVGNKSLKMAKK